MDYITFSERLDYLLEMAKKGRISSPKQISQKLNCCDKTARNMINALRRKGYNIGYYRTTAKYFIENISR